jgi:hypothetical protein
VRNAYREELKKILREEENQSLPTLEQDDESAEIDQSLNILLSEAGKKKEPEN